MDYQPPHIAVFSGFVDYFREVPECATPVGLTRIVTDESMHALHQLARNGDIRLTHVRKDIADLNSPVVRAYQLTKQGATAAVQLYKEGKLPIQRD